MSMYVYISLICNVVVSFFVNIIKIRDSPFSLFLVMCLLFLVFLACAEH